VALAPTVPPCSPEPFGVVPVFAAADDVSGVAHDEDLPPCLLTPPSVSPEVQAVRPVDVRRHGAHPAPLAGPFHRRGPWPCCPPARVPPWLPVVHDALVPPPLRAELHQPCGGDRLHAPTAVRLTHPVAGARRDAPRHGLQGLLWAAAGAQAIGAPAPRPRVDGVQPLHRGPLDALLVQGRDAEGPLAALRRRDVDPLDRAGVVRPALEAV
jgi:hypothetical protein